KIVHRCNHRTPDCPQRLPDRRRARVSHPPGGQYLTLYMYPFRNGKHYCYEEKCVMLTIPLHKNFCVVLSKRCRNVTDEVCKRVREVADGVCVQLLQYMY